MLHHHSRLSGWLRVVLFPLVIVIVIVIAIGLAGLVLRPAARPDTVTPKRNSPVGALVVVDPAH